MKIQKRDGRVVPYEEEKIREAIHKANNEVEERYRASEGLIEEILEDVQQEGRQTQTVEHIQDMIEEHLVEHNKYTLAKKYIVYRYQRSLLRKSNTTDESILKLIRNENKELAEENSNKNTRLASTQRDYIAGEVSRDVTRRLLLPEHIAMAHDNGVLHFHDADYFIQPIFNCCLINIKDMLDNGTSINGKIKVVFIENYRVSNAEWIFAAADVSEQISTASKEASGTGNMKFMLNGAPTLGTMDGANVEIVEEVGAENAFIFGLSSDEVINYENNGGYDPNVIYNTDEEIRQVLMQLINGTFSNDTELFRDLYDSLLNTKNTDRADRYFILADFRSYADAQKRVEAAYRDEKGWAKKALLNTACSGKFTSDRTIQEYVDDIWHLDKVIVRKK